MVQYLKALIPLICAVFIFVVEIIALCKGINGKCLSIAIAALAGLGGYGLKELIGLFKR